MSGPKRYWWKKRGCDATKGSTRAYSDGTLLYCECSDADIRYIWAKDSQNGPKTKPRLS